MTPIDEFDQARRVLENAESYELLPRHANQRVTARVWLYPTFTPAMSWTVIATRAALLVRRLVWNPSLRVATLHGYFGSEAHLPLEPWRALQRDLDGISLRPFRQESGVGRDGDTYGIELPGELSSARLTWWQEPPAGWEGLARWHAEAVALFQSVLPQATV